MERKDPGVEKKPEKVNLTVDEVTTSHQEGVGKGTDAPNLPDEPVQIEVNVYDNIGDPGLGF